MPLSAFNPYQTIDFEKLYGQSVSKTAYLYTEISVPEEKRYLFLINNDCAVKLWIDGKLAHEDLRHHPAEGWLRQLELPLPKGRHKVFVRVEQDAKPDSKWQENYWLFRMRIRDRRKTPSKIMGLECGGEK